MPGRKSLKDIILTRTVLPYLGSVMSMENGEVHGGRCGVRQTLSNNKSTKIPEPCSRHEREDERKK